MNNEEKNFSQNDESVEIDNDVISELETSDEVKKPSNSFLTIIITLVACLLVAVIMIVALLPKNNDNTGDNNDGGSQNGGNDDEGNDGGTSDAKTNYVITVVDQNGNAVKGVEITFYVEDGVSFPRTTDEEGGAYYTTAKKVQVAVTSVPSNYDYIKLNQKQTPSANGSLEIVVERKADEYFEVNVVDQYGNPVAGVTVQICAEVCRTPQVTNEEGKAYFAYDASVEYHAQLTNGLDALPEGYTIDDADQYFYFSGKVATIVVTKTN